MKSAIIIPSYKAQITLPGVIDSLPGEIAERGHVFIVNDACPDSTGAVADDLASKHAHVTAIHHQVNRGYGGALKTGMVKACEEGYDIMVVVHADGQYAPDLAIELCEPIARGETEIVQGSRMLGGGARQGGMPLTRYLPNRILTALENLAFGTEMADFHSGYMLYSRKLLAEVPFEKLQDNYNFDAEMIIMAHLAGIRCAQIPIPTRYDDEISSLKPIPYGLNVLRMIGNFLRGHYRALLAEHRAASKAP